MAVVVVACEHAPATHPTGDQASEERAAATRNARISVAVGGHLLLVPLKGAPVNVGRIGPPLQHRPGLRITPEAAPAVWLARHPQATVLVAPAVDVGTGVGGVAEHVGEGRPAGPVPPDVSLVGSGADAVRELDVVVDEIAQDTAGRAPPLKDGEDQADHLLDPFIRIQGDLT